MTVYICYKYPVEESWVKNKILTADISPYSFGAAQPIKFDLGKIDYYRNKLTIVNVFKLIYLIGSLRKHIRKAAVDLSNRAAQIRKVLDALTLIDDSQKVDLSNLFIEVNSEIEKYGDLQAKLEALSKYPKLKYLGRFDEMEKGVTQIIEASYDVLRAAKRVSKRSIHPTSQLAKDLSSHSFSTLAKIINGR